MRILVLFSTLCLEVCKKASRFVWDITLELVTGRQSSYLATCFMLPKSSQGMKPTVICRDTCVGFSFAVMSCKRTQGGAILTMQVGTIHIGLIKHTFVVTFARISSRRILDVSVAYHLEPQ